MRAAYLLLACQYAIKDSSSNALNEPASSRLSSLLLETSNALLPPFSSHLGRLIAKIGVSMLLKEHRSPLTVFGVENVHFVPLMKSLDERSWKQSSQPELVVGLGINYVGLGTRDPHDKYLIWCTQTAHFALNECVVHRRLDTALMKPLRHFRKLPRL
jgi:hypothetical protein